MQIHVLPAHVSPRLPALSSCCSTSSSSLSDSTEATTPLSEPISPSGTPQKLVLPPAVTSSLVADFGPPHSHHLGSPLPVSPPGIITPPVNVDDPAVSRLPIPNTATTGAARVTTAAATRVTTTTTTSTSTATTTTTATTSSSLSLHSPYPRLVDTLPTVKCVVRARIPTTSGAEMFLHLYHNDVDTKEHLAIVFGSSIRSKSLDEVVPGETEMDRMIRGAYVGRLHPGRTSSSHTLETASPASGTPDPPLPSPARAAAAAAAAALPSVESQIPLVRIHSECYTGETVWSARCDCGEQLDEAAKLMSQSDPAVGGVIVYLRQEGRGIGLSEKLKAYNLQDLGNDTYEANLLLRHPADARSYGVATAILVDLGLGGGGGSGSGGSAGAAGAAAGGIRLLTNNPDKVRAVEGPGLEVRVRERVPMVPLAWRTNGQRGFRTDEVDRYLATKIEKFKHMLEM